MVQFFIILMFLSFSAIPVSSQDQTPQPSERKALEMAIAELDELMVNKTIENCEKAIKGYKLLLEKKPNHYKILYKLANAHTAILDIKTSALIVEKNEFKPMLREMGKTANEYAKRAYQLKPGDKDVIASTLVSYAYYSASFGIVKAIFKGAAGRYKKLARELIAVDDKHLGALGYRMMGKLYHVAPWPVGSSRKALKFFKKAVEADNTVLYSHYYLGELLFDKDKYDLAEKEFKFVVENEPASHEKHLMEAYKKEAGNYLTKIAKKKRDD